VKAESHFWYWLSKMEERVRGDGQEAQLDHRGPGGGGQKAGDTSQAGAGQRGLGQGALRRP